MTKVLIDNGFAWSSNFRNAAPEFVAQAEADGYFMGLLVDTPPGGQAAFVNHESAVVGIFAGIV